MRRTIAMWMALGLILAACSGQAADAEPTEVTFGDSGGDAELSEDGNDGLAPEPGKINVEFATPDGRQVIRRASLDLHAADTRAAFDQIVASVQAAGGFVADATVFPTDSEQAQPQVSLTLRVPSDELPAMLDAIKATADEVVSETQGAEDVTEQFVDLEARLTNLEALEVELRALLTEVRQRDDADPDEILRVFNEVASVRGQIEQLQGQLNYLSDLTALATVSVAITQTPTSAPLVDEPWNPGATAREATGSLLQGLQGIADWAINFAIVALPMLILIVGPTVAIGVFAYRRFFNKPPTPTTS